MRVRRNALRTGIDDKLVAIVAAGSVLLYLTGVAVFALNWGSKLTRIMKNVAAITARRTSSGDTPGINVEQAAKDKKQATAYAKTLSTIRDLTKELGKFVCLFLFAVFLLGGGQASQNAWIIQLSLGLVYLAQFQVVQCTCKSALLGKSQKIRGQHNETKTSRVSWITDKMQVGSSFVSNSSENFVVSTSVAPSTEDDLSSTEA